MAKRSVYLGNLDIDRSGSLELKKNNGEEFKSQDILIRLFAYGLIADEVLMQGSAPLKCTNIYLAFIVLHDAFIRNEEYHPFPIFSFVLSSESESYSDYISQRYSFLNNLSSINAERYAYIKSNALEIANLLDLDLYSVDIKKRTKSVSKKFRDSLTLSLTSKNVVDKLIPEKISRLAIEYCNNNEVIQTFSLIESLEINNEKISENLYNITRNYYKQSNAYGSNSTCSETGFCPQFRWRNAIKYLCLLKLGVFLDNQEILNTKNLFRIRKLECIKILNECYFDCQDQDEIDIFLSILEIRSSGKIRSIAEQSPDFVLSFLFNTLNELKIGYKPVNKLIEQISKIIISDVSAEIFSKKIHKIYDAYNQLEKEIEFLVKA